MGQRTLASALAAWSDHTLQMQSAKQAMRQVAARLTNRQLAAAFYSWHEATVQKQHAVQSAHKALLKLQQGCLVMLPSHAAVLTTSWHCSACLYLRTPSVDAFKHWPHLLCWCSKFVGDLASRKRFQVNDLKRRRMFLACHILLSDDAVYCTEQLWLPAGLLPLMWLHSDLQPH